MATMEDSMEILLKPRNKPPYDPTISLLGINPEETKPEKDTRTPVFIAAPLTRARTWRHLDVHQQRNG